MTSLLHRAFARPTFALVGVALLLVGLGTFAQSLLLLPVTPDPVLCARLFLASLGCGLGLALPVGTLAGVVEGARRLREDGAWRGLATLGVSGRRTLGPVLGWLAALAVVAGCAAHFAEPWSRAELREVAAEAGARVELLPGRTVSVGPWAFAADGPILHFAGEGWIGTADSWRLEAAEGAVVARLSGVDARSTVDGTILHADAARVPILLPVERRAPHVTDLDTPSLLAAWARHAPDPYARWIGWKRTVLPCAGLLCGLALFPLGLGGQRQAGPRSPSAWSPFALTAAAVLTLWVAVRALDAAAPSIGAGGATFALLGGLAVVCGAAWATWEDA